MNILQWLNYILSAFFVAVGLYAIYAYFFYGKDVLVLLAGIALIVLQVWKYISDGWIITIDYDEEEEL
jgi:general stress protein CsbA